MVLPLLLEVVEIVLEDGLVSFNFFRFVAILDMLFECLVIIKLFLGLLNVILLYFQFDVYLVLVLVEVFHSLFAFKLRLLPAKSEQLVVVLCNSSILDLGILDPAGRGVLDQFTQKVILGNRAQVSLVDENVIVTF